MLRKLFGKLIVDELYQYVGIEGEIIVDLDTDRMYLMDGVTPGGRQIGGNILPPFSTGYLYSDGYGNLSWQTPAGGGAVSSVAGRTGDVTLTVNDISGFSAFDQDLIPDQDVTRYLGTPSHQWHSVYVGPGSIYIGNVKISNSNGTLVSSQVTIDPNTGQTTTIVENAINTDRLLNSAGNVSVVLSASGNLQLPLDGGLVFGDGTRQTTAATSNSTTNTGDITFNGNSISSTDPNTVIDIISVRGAQLRGVNTNDTASHFDLYSQITANNDGTVLVQLTETTRDPYTDTATGTAQWLFQPSGTLLMPNNAALNTGGNTWTFGSDGGITLPGNILGQLDNNISIVTEQLLPVPPATIVISGADFSAVNLTYIKDSGSLNWYPADYNPGHDPYIEFTSGYGIRVPGFGQALYVNTGTLNVPLAQWNTNPPLGSVAPTGVYTYLPATYSWTFGTDGVTTFPDGTQIYPGGRGLSGATIAPPPNTNFNIATYGGAWTFGRDGSIALPLGGTIKETAFVSNNAGNDLQGTLILTPNGVYNPWNSLTIYNTAFNPETQHIHLASGDMNRTEVVLGNDDKFVKVNLDGSVCVKSSPYYFEGAMAFEFQNDGTNITEMHFSLGVYPRLYYVAVGDIITDVSSGNTAVISDVILDSNLSVICNIPMDTVGASPLGYSFSKPNNAGGLWQFGTDSTLALPNGSKIGGGDSNSGVLMTTSRGTILFGNQPEPGEATHFHIMKENPTAVDLFFGDDYNYVKLPNDTTGVEVGANSNTWKFADTGNLIIPGDIVSTAVGTPTISSATDIDLAAANRVTVSRSPLRFANMDTAMRNSITAAEGDVIFNTDTHALQGFTNGAWSEIAAKEQITQLVNQEFTVNLTNTGALELPAGGELVFPNGTVQTTAADSVPFENIDIDGGGASSIYEVNRLYADGGTASNRFGAADVVFDGSTAGKMYNNTDQLLNGGVA